MRQYLNLCEHIMANGKERPDRTGTGVRGVFGYQMRFDLNAGFPLMTTKKTAFRLIFEELMWFIRGETNIRPLLLKDIHIWDGDAYRYYREQTDFTGEIPMSEEMFIRSIIENEEFARLHGDLGRIYGAQWRSWDGPDGPIDQLEALIKGIKEDPYGRRHLVTAWNPGDNPHSALPPCHVLFQFYIQDDRVSCQLYQRSCDVFLGLPFNIASYALLTHMVAHLTGYGVGEFIWTGGDIHIYQNHFDQIGEQILREPRQLPSLSIYGDFHRLEDFTLDAVRIEGYDPHDKISGKVSNGPVSF